MTNDVPTEPPSSGGTARPPGERELRRALERWLEGRPLPGTLRRLLTAAVLEPREEGRARRLGVPPGDLPAWERCFARWTLSTLDSAVEQVWALALAARASEEEE